MEAGTRRSGLHFAHAVSILTASAVIGGEGHCGRAVAMRNYSSHGWHCFDCYPEFQTCKCRSIFPSLSSPRL
jgi:hypothetical protein